MAALTQRIREAFRLSKFYFLVTILWGVWMIVFVLPKYSDGAGTIVIGGVLALILYALPVALFITVMSPGRRK